MNNFSTPKWLRTRHSAQLMTGRWAWFETKIWARSVWTGLKRSIIKSRLNKSMWSTRSTSIEPMIRTRSKYHQSRRRRAKLVNWISLPTTLSLPKWEGICLSLTVGWATGKKLSPKEWLQIKIWAHCECPQEFTTTRFSRVRRRRCDSRTQ